MQLGIEPNEHQITRFLGKYGYHTHLWPNHNTPSKNLQIPILVSLLMREVLVTLDLVSGGVSA